MAQLNRIKISQRAAKKLDQLLTYLVNEWGNKVKDDFLNELQESFLHIQNFPELAENSRHFPNLRRVVVTKQTIYLYRFKNDFIEVIALFDTRMDPKRFKKML